MITSMPGEAVRPSSIDGPIDPSTGIPADALALLVGAAGSGKSTWAQGHYRPSQIVSSDALRQLVADDAADQSASRDAFRLLHLVARARLERGLLTVIDATNLRRSARKPLLALAARFGRPYVAVVFDVPLAVLLARNAARDRVVPEDVVRRHNDEMAVALEDIQGEGYRLILHVQS
jgi:predicted kinase